MPQSKLSTFVIDCRTSNLDEAASFWSQALRRPLRPAVVGHDNYRSLAASPSEPLLMLQAVDHESRIHLDIESDDIEAEVLRLEGLGAKRLKAVHTWVVMEAPTGQRFCVVRPQRGVTELRHDPLPPALAALVGHYRGKTSVWLHPDATPDLSETQLHVVPVVGGRFVRLEELGAFEGKPRSAELLLGFHEDARRFEATWVDTFHTGSSQMWCHGPAREDGVVAVTGSYGPASERWGWRTELERGEGLVVRAYNITPGGEELLAIESRFEISG